MKYHTFRIERLWRDVWCAVTTIYYSVLHSLEDDGFIDLSNNMHLFSCHYVFLPRIQASLDAFHDGWDNHPIRTEGNMTPNQLWEMGNIQHEVAEPEFENTEVIKCKTNHCNNIRNCKLSFVEDRNLTLLTQLMLFKYLVKGAISDLVFFRSKSFFHIPQTSHYPLASCPLNTL